MICLSFLMSDLLKVMHMSKDIMLSRVTAKIEVWNSGE